MSSAQQTKQPADAASPNGGDSTQTALQQLSWLTWLPVSLMSALLVAAVAAPMMTRLLALPLAVAGSLTGLPHGAIDHLVPRWASGSDPTSGDSLLAGQPIVLVAVGYASVAGAALAGMLLFPVPILVLFLVVSAGHFGWGEVETSAHRAGRGMPAIAREWPVAAACGLLVVGSVVWLRPSQTGSITAELSRPLARAAMASRGAGLLLIAAAVLIGLGLLVRRARYLEAAELMLLTLTFAIAPPLAAFGIYFGGWHSVRHLGRLLDLAARHTAAAAPRDLRLPDWTAAARSLLRVGWLPSVISFAGVAVLWLTRDRAGLTAEVAVLLSLTFPHVLAVRTLDRAGIHRG